ncbi:hypothetical protein BD770DRAFT_425035 [Pilaira anomala]|nr:hypothetical protein BD770DRAFT_425035 [Pilaira anomala]
MATERSCRCIWRVDRNLNFGTGLVLTGCRRKDDGSSLDTQRGHPVAYVGDGYGGCWTLQKSVNIFPHLTTQHCMYMYLLFSFGTTLSRQRVAEKRITLQSRNSLTESRQGILYQKPIGQGARDAEPLCMVISGLFKDYTPSFRVEATVFYMKRLSLLVLSIECDDFAGQKFWAVWACILRFVVIVTTSLSVKQGPYSEVNKLVPYKLGFGSGEKESRTLDRCALFYNQNSLFVDIRYG